MCCTRVILRQPGSRILKKIKAKKSQKLLTCAAETTSILCQETTATYFRKKTSSEQLAVLIFTLLKHTEHTIG